jgi:hypothetical protein
MREHNQMMSAIRVETTVDEPTAQAIPALRPLLGQRIELTAVPSSEAKAVVRSEESFDRFLEHRLTAPSGLHLSLDDVEKAIEGGARGAID